MNSVLWWHTWNQVTLTQAKLDLVCVWIISFDQLTPIFYYLNNYSIYKQSHSECFNLFFSFCIYITTTTDSVMNRIRCVVTNFEDEPENVRMSFNLFLRNVVALLSDRREQEELSIIEWCRFMLSVTQRNIFYFFYKILSFTVFHDIFAKLNGWNFSLKLLLKKIFFNILKTIFFEIFRK